MKHAFPASQGQTRGLKLGASGPPRSTRNRLAQGPGLEMLDTEMLDTFGRNRTGRPRAAGHALYGRQGCPPPRSLPPASDPQALQWVATFCCICNKSSSSLSARANTGSSRKCKLLLYIQQKFARGTASGLRGTADEASDKACDEVEVEWRNAAAAERRAWVRV